MRLIGRGHLPVYPATRPEASSSYGVGIVNGMLRHWAKLKGSVRTKVHTMACKLFFNAGLTSTSLRCRLCCYGKSCEQSSEVKTSETGDVVGCGYWFLHQVSYDNLYVTSISCQLSREETKLFSVTPAGGGLHEGEAKEKKKSLRRRISRGLVDVKSLSGG